MTQRCGLQLEMALTVVVFYASCVVEGYLRNYGMYFDLVLRV